MSNQTATHNPTAYEQRVTALQAEGMTRGDAQGIADAEELANGPHTPLPASGPTHAPRPNVAAAQAAAQAALDCPYCVAHRHPSTPRHNAAAVRVTPHAAERLTVGALIRTATGRTYRIARMRTDHGTGNVTGWRFAYTRIALCDPDANDGSGPEAWATIVRHDDFLEAQIVG